MVHKYLYSDAISLGGVLLVGYRTDTVGIGELSMPTLDARKILD